MTAVRRTRTLAAIGLVACTIGLAGQPARQADSRTGLIVGQVVDAAGGKPVSGAIVSIGGAARAAPRILTGSSGRFVFRDLPPGNFTITAAKPGYAPGAYGRRRPSGPSQALRLDADERVGDVSVRIWKHAAIGGTVVDETGELVVRVQLRAWLRTIVGGRARLAPAGTTLTDDRGIYRFGGLLPGEYVVAASAFQIILPLTAAATQAIPIGPSALLVRDFIYRLGEGTVTPPPPGDRFSFYTPSYYAGAAEATHATLVAVASGEERLGADLQVYPTPTVRVSGMLVSPDGPGVRQIVRLVPEGRLDTALQEDAPATITDGDGDFVFPAVPTGRYTLRSTSAMQVGGPSPLPDREMVWAATALQIGSIDLERLTVALVPALHITGRLEFESSSLRPSPARLAQIPLLVESADGDGELGPIPLVHPNADGEFTSAGLVGGRYIVRVANSPAGWMFKSASYGGRDVSSTPIDLDGYDAGNVVITFTDRWSGINGMVQSRGRNPDPDALVVMFPTDPQLWTGYGATGRRVRGVRAGKHGDYVFSSVPPGDYYLAAIPDEKADGWQDPASLEDLARGATRVTVREGETKRQDLRTRELR